MRRWIAATLAAVGATASLLNSTTAAQAADVCVYGNIGIRYDQLGAASGPLGQPLSCEASTERGGGRFTTFQNGAIYWSPATGAWDVSGAFRDLWLAGGYENGTLGFPTSGEVPISGGVFQNYQGGTMYWTQALGAHSVSGDFLRLYASQGYENGFLGFPTTQEVLVQGGVFQVFHGGVLYWSPSTGAHSVSGSFRGLYAAHGYEHGDLGFPSSQEVPSRDGGVYQNYQGGTMYWAPGLSPEVVAGPYLAEYRKNGYELGCLGYPVTNAYNYEESAWVQQFQGGWIWYEPGYGTYTNVYPRDPYYAQEGLFPRC